MGYRENTPEENRKMRANAEIADKAASRIRLPEGKRYMLVVFDVEEPTMTVFATDLYDKRPIVEAMRTYADTFEAQAITEFYPERA